MITPILSSNRISETEKSLFSRLGLLKRPSWCCRQRGHGDIRSLPAEATFVSVVHFMVKRHVNVPGLDCHLRLYWCLWSTVPHKIMVMPMVCAPTRGNVDVYGSWYQKTRLTSIVCAAAEGHDGVCGPWYDSVSCWYPWSILPLQATLRYMVLAVTGDHVDVCSSSCLQKQCGRLWSVLSLTGIRKEASVAVVVLTADIQLRKRGT